MTIQIQNISKSYNQKKLFSDYSLEIPSKMMTAIIGSSGAGKSTLLYMISGLTKPDSGNILVDGVSLKSISNKQKNHYLRKKFGFIFQDYGLIDYNTVYENMYNYAAYSNVKVSVKGNKAMNEALTSVGLNNYGSRKTYELSGGEKQRVAIACMLLKDPEIIFADEPTGSLDKQNKDEVLSLLLKLKETGKTIIIVTHDMGVAEYADKIVTL